MDLYNGVINLKKERGMTSHTAVARVRKILKIDKVGHPGTLDPEATGVLPILVGSATKASDYFLNIGKKYIGTAKFGIKTDTQDIWGTVTEESQKPFPEREEIEAALKQFVGKIQQIPPMYSALKKDGVPLYKLARQGETLEIEARTVEVYDIKLLDYSKEEGLAKIFVHCGRGTYIRTIINDLGDALGNLAAMAALERVAYGSYEIENAVTLAELETNPEQYILPTEDVFEALPKFTLNEINFTRYLQGKTVVVYAGAADFDDNGGEMRLYTPEGNFFATCTKKPLGGGKYELIRGRFFGA